MDEALRRIAPASASPAACEPEDAHWSMLQWGRLISTANRGESDIVSYYRTQAVAAHAVKRDWREYSFSVPTGYAVTTRCTKAHEDQREIPGYS